MNYIGQAIMPAVILNLLKLLYEKIITCCYPVRLLFYC